MKNEKQKFWTIGGGKGGVGKSFLTASMGVVLAQMGHSVIAVDADLGSANLHTFVGIKNPAFSLVDVLKGRASAQAALLATPEPGLRLLSCGSGILGMANPDHSEKQKILKFILGLEADFILVDLGAGTSYNVLDFFNLSHEGIVVASPDPASIQSAYSFLKSAVYRRIQRGMGKDATVAGALLQLRDTAASSRPRTMIDFYELLCTTQPRVAESVASLVEGFRPLIIVNQANSDQDQRVAEILQSTSKRFLNVDLRFCGLILSDPAAGKVVQRMSILDFKDKSCLAGNQIRATVKRLLNSAENTRQSGLSDALAPATPTMGLNDNLEFKGKQLHIQTENLGFTGRCITTQVFCNGQVLLSTKSEYPSPLQASTDPAQIGELMRKQHFEVIRELEDQKLKVMQQT
jgi:flagellar biosynthesis protein FlhG